MFQGSLHIRSTSFSVETVIAQYFHEHWILGVPSVAYLISLPDPPQNCNLTVLEYTSKKQQAHLLQLLYFKDEETEIQRENYFPTVGWR